MLYRNEKNGDLTVCNTHANWCMQNFEEGGSFLNGAIYSVGCAFKHTGMGISIMSGVGKQNAPERESKDKELEVMKNYLCGVKYM